MVEKIDEVRLAITRFIRVLQRIRTNRKQIDIDIDNIAI